MSLKLSNRDASFNRSWLPTCELLNLLSVFTAGIFNAWKWLPVAALLMFLIGWARWYELVLRIGGQKPATNIAHIIYVLTLNLERGILVMALAFGMGFLIKWLLSST